MNYGLYISASGMSVQMARQDVLSNNLANVSTTAFRPDVLAIRQRDPVRREDHLPHLSSNRLLEKLGAGVMPVATRMSTARGPLENTCRPLDVAIDGEGFMRIRTGPGVEGVRLTRDGRLAISSEGYLVHAAGGHHVLDSGGQPIRVEPDCPVTIQSDGTLVQKEVIVGRLALVTVPDPTRLTKSGGGLLGAPTGEVLGTTPASVRVKQGFIEMSATNAVDAMMQVTDASRAVESSASVIGYINEMMGKAINTFGRVT